MIAKIPLAWLQLTHQKGRLLVTLAGVAFAVILMFMQVGFRDALFEDSITIHKTLAADLVLLSPKSVALFGLSSFPERRLYDALEIEGVASARPFYLSGGRWKNPENASSREIVILAFDPDKPVFNLPDVENNLATIRLADVLLFDRLSRSEFGSVAAEFEQNGTVTTEMNGRKIRVGGLFSMGGGVLSADGLVITSDLNYLRITGNSTDEIDLGLVRLQPGADPLRVKSALMAQLPEDVRAITRQEFLEFEIAYWQGSTPIGFIFSLGSAMGFFIGAIIVYQILYTDVTNHLAEYATLKAMGYTNGYLLGAVFQEALLLASLGFIPGLAISLILYDVTRDAARLPMATDASRVLFLLGLTVLMCFTSGAIAVRKLRGADPADIF
jgi:putative ABC transport system permease protein